MRIAVLSDIHGNAIALSRCLDRLDEIGIDALYVLGDCVGYLPGEDDVLRQLDAAGAQYQQGNHETYLLRPTDRTVRNEGIYGLEQARARLGPARLAAIAAWPTRRTLDVDGRRLLLVHGGPDDPIEGYIYPDTDLGPYADLPYDLIFMGHTHRPFVRRRGAKLFVNVGSVGLPRDHGATAACALWDSRSGAARVLRVPFDVDRVLQAYGPGLPEQVRDCFQRRPPEPVEDIVA